MDLGLQNVGNLAKVLAGQGRQSGQGDLFDERQVRVGLQNVGVSVHIAMALDRSPSQVKVLHSVKATPLLQDTQGLLRIVAELADGECPVLGIARVRCHPAGLGSG